MDPLALGLVLGSAALHALWSVVIKRSDDPVAFNAVQMAPAFVLLPALALWLPGIPAQLLDGSASSLAFWRWTAAAAVAHGLYMLWLGRALADADLSLVYPIARSTPALLPFVAGPLLGERVSGAGALGIATVVAGMWAVQTRGRLGWAALARPEARFAWWTLLATVAYATTDAGAMRALDGVAWPFPLPRSLLYCLLTMVGGTLVLVPLLLVTGSSPRRLLASARTEGGRALIALAFSLLGYSLILEALRTTPASYVVTVRQTSVLFAVAIGALWLHERPGAARVVGACVIVVGIAVLGVAG